MAAADATITTKPLDRVCGLSAEKRFLLCVERGDVATVQSELALAAETHHLDINCVDPVGRSALVISIENENLEMMRVLLDGHVETKEALLHAIDEEFVEAVEILLERGATAESERTTGTESSPLPSSLPSPSPADESRFAPDLTPLVLAAHKNNYEMLKILLECGERVPHPHDVKCSCDTCVRSSNENGVRHSRSRIDAYRALTSPSLIALTSRDPILTAFLLSKELRRLSNMETEFKKEYQKLKDNVEEFAMELLSHVRTSDELSVVLNHDTGWTEGQRVHDDDDDDDDDGNEDDGKNEKDAGGDKSDDDEATERQPSGRMKLARLKMSIKYEQKKFVAHPNVQRALSTIWYDGMPGFRRKSFARQARQIMFNAIAFPFHSCLHLVAPRSAYGRRLRRPFVKFICHSASYCLFLVLLVMVSQRVETTLIRFISRNPWSSDVDDDHGDYEEQEEDVDMLVEDRYGRGATPSYVEWAIIVYVFGFVWAELKQMRREGVVGYFGDMWNVVDTITNGLYLTWMALRLVSYVQMVEGRRREDSMLIVERREDWDPFDPMLISEGVFGAANICSFLKIVHMFSVNEHLGPLQISLGQMVYDIIKFFFIYMLVLLAFGCGLGFLWYYAEADRRRCYSLPNRQRPNPTEEKSCDIWRRFSNLFETSQSLFWSSFGLVDLKNFELTGIKDYTRFWGLFMLGFYSTVSTVVLLNLLIAMMTNSYQLISEHADVEWKFARSRLWISYFDDGGTLPPPFNIVPTPKALVNLLGFRNKHWASMKAVMASLVRRYITTEQRKRDEQRVTEDDINEVKQDINTFRYEMRNILRENGMSVPVFDMTSDYGFSGSSGRKERIKERRLLKGLNIGVLGETLSTNMATTTTMSRLLPDNVIGQDERLITTTSTTTMNDGSGRQASCNYSPSGQRLLRLARNVKKSSLPEEDEEPGHGASGTSIQLAKDGVHVSYDESKNDDDGNEYEEDSHV